MREKVSTIGQSEHGPFLLGKAVVCAPAYLKESQMSTIFSKIFSGEIPSHKIYEDDAVGIYAKHL